MKPINSRFNPSLIVLLASLLSLCVQAQPEFTVLRSPEGNLGFGGEVGSLPDLTKDGVGEFYLHDTHRIYVCDGASLAQLYAIDSAPLNATCDPDFSTGTADSAGDLTGDGVPDLMFGQVCIGRVIMVDGATGKELFRLRSLNLADYFGQTVRLLPDMTGDRKEDWLIHAREGGYESGQSGSPLGAVHVFDSQTRKVVRTLRNTEAEYNFSMAFVEVIPDVDGDGKPELLTSAPFATVSRDGRTYSKAGRALVRSLETGKVLSELLDPEPTINGRFGVFALRGIGDISGDGIGDIAIGAWEKKNWAGGVYLFSGADGRWLRTLRSPKSQLGAFGGGIEVMGDLNGDRVPELWIEESIAKLSHLYDGLTGELLKTIEYPGLVHNHPHWAPKFRIGTVRQEASPGVRAFLFAAPAAANYEGRVYYMPFTGLPKPAHLTALARTASAFRLQMTGKAGSRFEIQSTRDFTTWEAADTVTITDNQPLVIDDSTAGNQPHRFYRAIQKD